MDFSNVNKQERAFAYCLVKHCKSPCWTLNTTHFKRKLKNKIKYKSKTMKRPSNETELHLNQQVDCNFQMQDFKVT